MILICMLSWHRLQRRDGVKRGGLESRSFRPKGEANRTYKRALSLEPQLSKMAVHSAKVLAALLAAACLHWSVAEPDHEGNCAMQVGIRRKSGGDFGDDDTPAKVADSPKAPATEATAEEPAAEEPMAEETAPEEPAAEEPAAKEPEAKEPEAEESAVEEPAVEEPGLNIPMLPPVYSTPHLLDLSQNPAHLHRL